MVRSVVFVVALSLAGCVAPAKPTGQICACGHDYAEHANYRHPGENAWGCGHEHCLCSRAPGDPRD